MPSKAQGLSPSRLSHFVLRTTPANFKPMVAWYKSVLQAEVAFENEFVCFMSYDDEHHRIGIGCNPAIADRPNNLAGVDHIAFAYETVGDLVTTYERLKAEGIKPLIGMHHGGTLSMYYQDLDKNRVEILVDCFPTRDETWEFVQSEQFTNNPSGVKYDPDELAKRYHEGVSEAELKKPLYGPPPDPSEWPQPH